MVFCLSEDREIDEIGLRVAVCSMRRHCPKRPVFVFRASPSDDFRRWLMGFPSVTLLPYSPPGASSWNCKPQALLHLMERGCDEVIWLDADLLLARDCQYLFRDLDPEVLAVAQEPASAPNQGSESRTEAWGLPVGRRFGRTLNTCVVRATRRQRGFLERWKSLLEEPRYTRYQTLPLHERPQHCWGDQDVLNALLGSSEFSAIPVRELRTGVEVIHCSSATSYSLAERLAGLFREVPPFIHCQAGKPWVLFHRSNLQSHTLSAHYNRLVVESAAYFRECRGYRSEMGRDSRWMDYRSLGGMFLSLIGAGEPALRGLPLTALASLAKAARNS